MELDIFINEQEILDNAQKAIADDTVITKESYAELTKQYERLLRQLRRSTSLADKTTNELYKSNLSLEEKVHHDGLTEIYNRRYLDDSLPRIIKALSRASGELSVLMIDIDFFKNYNDTYGHAQGDTCLKKVAAQLQTSLARASDVVARYGGEEFIIILPNTNEKGARRVAERILNNIASINIPHETSDAAPYVTVSVGGTTAQVMYTQTPEDYIKRADQALYISKNNGRARYTFLECENTNFEEVKS